MMLFAGWVFVLISAALNVGALIKPGGRPLAVTSAAAIFTAGCFFLGRGYAEKARDAGRP